MVSSEAWKVQDADPGVAESRGAGMSRPPRSLASDDLGVRETVALGLVGDQVPGRDVGGNPMTLGPEVAGAARGLVELLVEEPLRRLEALGRAFYLLLEHRVLNVAPW